MFQFGLAVNAAQKTRTASAIFRKFPASTGYWTVRAEVANSTTQLPLLDQSGHITLTMQLLICWKGCWRIHKTLKPPLCQAVTRPATWSPAACIPAAYHRQLWHGRGAMELPVCVILIYTLLTYLLPSHLGQRRTRVPKPKSIFGL